MRLIVVVVKTSESQVIEDYTVQERPILGSGGGRGGGEILETERS